MDVNQCIVEILQEVGVDHVFGGSGQVNASMLMALRDAENMKTLIVKNEQAASFMACGYGMFSDKLGVCFSTGGPGAFNLFSGMAVAYSDSLPVLAITGYTSSKNRGKGALNESTGLSRTPDSHKMFAATTKGSFIIEEANQTCDILEEAINLAFNGRPGPVHVHVPKDITMADVTNYRNITLDIKEILPDKKTILRIADHLERSMTEKKRVMLLIGYGAVRSHATEELMAMVDNYNIPFATTMDAKGILPEMHAMSLGVFGTSGDLGANDYFEKADTVMALGNSCAQNATFSFKEDLYQGKTLIHINIDPHEIGKVYQATIGLVSDIKPALKGIMEELKSREVRGYKPEVIRHKFYDEVINSSSDKIHPAHLVQMISKNLPEGSIILGDAGAHMLWLNCYLNLNQHQFYQNPGSFGPMASHVNGAIGVQCANPERTVVAACGDGGYLMAGFELLTAVEHNIPVIWVVFNNSEFNVIKKFLINIYGDYAYMQFKNPDYVKYANACGSNGYHIEQAEDFEEVFRTAIAERKPVLIDVVVESEVYPPFALAKV